MKEKFLLILGVFLIVWSFYMFFQQPAPAKYLKVSTSQVDKFSLQIGGKTIPVEIADTDAKRIQGLSGRESLPIGTGLLFIFEKSAIQSFWMKDMLFPLDIIWVDENWTVIGIERSVKPDSYPAIFYSNGLAKYVLELNSGEASSLGIDIGSRLYLTP